MLETISAGAPLHQGRCHNRCSQIEKQRRKGTKFLVAAAIVFVSVPLLAGAELERGGQPLEPQLAGTWYWETSNIVFPSYYLKSSTYTPPTVLIMTVRWIKIEADGRFAFLEQTTHNGNKSWSGRIEKHGNTLKVFLDSGQQFTVQYQLSGSNGLWIDGVLYERK